MDSVGGTRAVERTLLFILFHHAALPSTSLPRALPTSTEFEVAVRVCASSTCEKVLLNLTKQPMHSKDPPHWRDEASRRKWNASSNHLADSSGKFEHTCGETDVMTWDAVLASPPLATTSQHANRDGKFVARLWMLPRIFRPAQKFRASSNRSAHLNKCVLEETRR